ncbi:MAG: nitroreductase A [Methanoregula sp. PtaU1.Bin051]|nr:MAG: nitroreductase A [Methanoregula sp. PtaU1.Bin051]
MQFALSTGALLLIATACIIAAGCMLTSQQPAGSGNAGTPSLDNSVALPAPRIAGSVSVEEALAARRSVREYAKAPLPLSGLSQLLWAAQGITDPAGLRTAPSAGALYPLEVYVACGNVSGLSPGVYHYLPQSHALEKSIDHDVRDDLYRSALRQPAIRDAPAVILIAADYNRTIRKYGERGARYVHMEAGHASENVYLQAYALGIGTVAIGAFDDRSVQSVLGLPQNEVPLYLMPVGKARM